MRALIIGSSGQDGSYLAEHLLATGREVFGLSRSPYAVDGVRLLVGDVVLAGSVRAAVAAAAPDEVYHLASVTSPAGAWGRPNPAGVIDVNAGGLVNVLDAVADLAPQATVVHASSSAIYDPHRYGLYGISKRAAHDIAAGYRTGYGLRVSNAVLYSHTSPRQDGRFLAPTICRTLARRAAGEDVRLRLTDVIGRRDWGFAPDLMAALPLIAAAPPGDFDVATGRQSSAGDFARAALDELDLSWDAAVDLVQGIPAPPERPADLGPLLALGWRPATPLEDMVRVMVQEAAP